MTEQEAVATELRDLAENIAKEAPKRVRRTVDQQLADALKSKEKELERARLKRDRLAADLESAEEEIKNLATSALRLHTAVYG